MPHDDFAIDVTHALEEAPVPAFVVDRDGRFRWLNRGAVAVIGNALGRKFDEIIAPEDRHIARAEFTKKLIGATRSSEYDVTVLAADGRRVPVRTSTVQLWNDGKLVGVFGLSYPAGSSDGPAREADDGSPQLTERQYEVLALLAEGLGTAAIAARLGVAEETARNHIRALLRQLRVHSRLEAVVVGYRRGLLHPRRENDPRES